MVIDCHVHVAASLPGHGCVSDRLERSIAMRFLRRRLRLRGTAAEMEAALAARLQQSVSGTPEIDAAVVLAFDAVYDESGRRQPDRTHLHVTNDYVIELCAKHPRMLFGASVHPYRPDALRELERCVAAGAVLLKWLPITQAIDPASPRCFEFYDALAHHGLPLLSHTGGERSLPRIWPHVADPRLLEPALERGVTVIAAHCGTRSWPGERDYLAEFVEMARRWPRLFGDTSALNMPTRSHAWPVVLSDQAVRNKLVHGSDWPIVPLPPARVLGVRAAIELMKEMNWIRRDVLIKKRLGLGDDYWHRAASVLRWPGGVAPSPPKVS